MTTPTLKNGPLVISASRRTDIPAYYADWFRSRLERAFTAYPNPYSGNPVFVSLAPRDVKAIVFWTRNPKPLFKHLDYIDKMFERRHYVHFTINGLPEVLEPRNPKTDYAVHSAEYLAGRYGEDYVQWRFDPIVVTNISSRDYVLERFNHIAQRLKGVTKRCYFSFLDLYEKTNRNFAILGKRKQVILNRSFTSQASDLTERVSMVLEMQRIVASTGIALYACAEEAMEHLPEIRKAHCIDADLVRLVSGDTNIADNLTPSRLGCGCMESRDIGYYDSCPHGCVYCYANMDPKTALRNARRYIGEGFPLDNLVPPASKNVIGHK